MRRFDDAGWWPTGRCFKGTPSFLRSAGTLLALAALCGTPNVGGGIAVSNAHGQPVPRPAGPTTPARPVTFSHQPASDFRAIDVSMGLADVSATAPAGSVSEMVVVIDGGSNGQLEFPMHREATGQVDRFSTRIMLSAPITRYSLRASSAGPGVMVTARPFEAPQTMTNPMPAWAMGTVWYQIFPERFRNGNPLNDPKGKAVFLADWNSDWYSVQPGELEAWQQRRGIDPAAFKPHPAGPLYNVIWDRRYGGDLQGVYQKLDELKELGVQAIYFNPIFAAESLHKYDASDFRHIDPRLAQPAEAGVVEAQDGTYTSPDQAAGFKPDDHTTWTWTPADRWFVDVFLPACKQRGIRVVLDGVWNHTGRQFWAFQDIVKNGRASAYADWFICEFDEEGKLKGWSGWDGKNGWLPEFRQVKGGAARDRDQTVEKGDLNAGVKAHIFAVTRRWMDPNNDGDPSDGIDGWRLDVAGEVGDEFWKDWRGLVKQINPNAITIAEIWSDASERFAAGSFDAQMHYPFAFPVIDWLGNKTPKGEAMSSTQLGEALASAFKDPPQINLIQQNLFASHDTDRFVSMLYNPGREYDRNCAVQNGDDKPRPSDPTFVPYKPGKPDERSYKLSLVGLGIQAMYQGSPMVYYGDEIGMWGADDPTCRKPMPWPDTGAPANADDAPVAGLREEYAKWLRLRSDKSTMAPVLRFGGVRHVETGNPDLFAFERHLNRRRVLVVANRSDESLDVTSLLREFYDNTDAPSQDVEGLTVRYWTK